MPCWCSSAGNDVEAEQAAIIAIQQEKRSLYLTNVMVMVMVIASPEGPSKQRTKQHTLGFHVSLSAGSGEDRQRGAAVAVSVSNPSCLGVYLFVCLDSAG